MILGYIAWRRRFVRTRAQELAGAGEQPFTDEPLRKLYTHPGTARRYADEHGKVLIVDSDFCEELHHRKDDRTRLEHAERMMLHWAAVADDLQKRTT